MNLNNYQITVRELLSNPKAVAILEQELPDLLHHPMLGFAKNMPLKKVLGFAAGNVPQETVDRVLRLLEEA